MSAPLETLVFSLTPAQFRTMIFMLGAGTSELIKTLPLEDMLDVANSLIRQQAAQLKATNTPL